MPNPIELQTSSQDGEATAPEHPLASSDIPNYSEHMETQENSTEPAQELSIEERQKFIEDPEERKAKIQTFLHEMTPEELKKTKEWGFDPEDYRGDDANDFFNELDDHFIMKHIDDLISCGIKPETFGEYIRGYIDEANSDILIAYLEPVLSHVGHGIEFETLLEICGIDSEEVEDDPLIPVAGYILKEDFDNLGGETGENTIDIMLKNGFTADEIVSSEPYIEYQFEKHVDALLDAGADPNKIADLFIEQEECGPLLYHLDSLISHGADIDIDKIVERVRDEYEAGYHIENNIDTLLKHGASKEKLLSVLEKINTADISEHTWSLLHEQNQPNPDESFIDFVENRNSDEQVKEKLSEFISNGVNLGYVINFFCCKDGSIDENGTDNIELHLDDPSVVQGFEDLLQYVDINQVLSHLSADTIALNTKYLKEKGANLEPYKKDIDGFFDQAEREMKNSGLV